MGSKIQTIYKKAEASFNKAENKQKWQGGIGILVMIVFVLSSVLLNETVQAVNQAAGNYGYYNNTYGYGGDTETSRETSDAVPAAITDLAATAGDGRVTLSWTAVTLTTTGTSLDNFDTVTNGYKVFYATSSASANSSSGTEWGPSNDSSLLTQATAGTTVTGLSNGTTYYFSVYSHDLNVNNSAISNIASKAPVASTSAGGGGGGTVTSLSSEVKTPTTTTVTQAPTGDQQVAAKPAAVTRLVALSITELKSTASVATALGVSELKVAAKVPEARRSLETITKEATLKTTEVKALLDAMEVVLAGVGEKNPELSTERGKEGFARDVFVTMGNKVLLQAAGDPKKAEVVAEFTAHIALGADFDRRVYGKDFPDFEKQLLAKEKETIQKGIFQKLFKRLPKTADEWELIHDISFRARVVSRNVKREVEGRQTYEITFKLNIAKLAKSTKKADKFKVSEAWSVIRQLADSKLKLK